MSDKHPPSRDVIAYHEAGHAVMRVRIGKELEDVAIDNATDDRGNPVLGCVHPPIVSSCVQRADWSADIGAVMVCMAGPAAQSKHTGISDDYHSWSDRQNAMAVIEQCTGSLTDDAPVVRFLVEAAYVQCRWMFDEEPALWLGVEFVANALIEKGRLKAKEVKALMRIAPCGE